MFSAVGSLLESGISSTDKRVSLRLWAKEVRGVESPLCGAKMVFFRGMSLRGVELRETYALIYFNCSLCDC